MNEWMIECMNNWMNEWVDVMVGRRRGKMPLWELNESWNKRNKSIIQLNQLLNQTINQSINQHQSINLSINQSINHQINKSIKVKIQSTKFNQSINKSVNQSFNEGTWLNWQIWTNEENNFLICDWQSRRSRHSRHALLMLRLSALPCIK